MRDQEGARPSKQGSSKSALGEEAAAQALSLDTVDDASAEEPWWRHAECICKVRHVEGSVSVFQGFWEWGWRVEG